MGTYLATHPDGSTTLFTADSDEAAERDASDAVELVALSEKDLAKMEADAAKARKAEAADAPPEDEE